MDHRRRLEPCDYLVDPHRFGRPGATLQLPFDGDEPSMWVARTQHLLVARWINSGGRPSVADLCERYALSKQTWSKCLLGERWASAAVLTALCETFLPFDP